MLQISCQREQVSLLAIG